MYPEDNVQKTNAPAASDLLLGRGVRFEGKLTFAGTVRIDASFVGTIVTDDVLVVGEAARIDANITCGTIVVHGEGGESEDSGLIAGPPEAEQEFYSWAVHLEEMCSASMIQVTHGRGAALRPRVIRTSVRPAALPRPRVAGTGIGCEIGLRPGIIRLR